MPHMQLFDLSLSALMSKLLTGVSVLACQGPALLGLFIQGSHDIQMLFALQLWWESTSEWLIPLTKGQ